MVRVNANKSSDSARQLVRALLEVLIRMGADLGAIETEIQKAKKGKPKPAKRREHSAAETSARALFLWHTDPKFLYVRGRPKPLRARGRSPSLESLVRRCNHGRCSASDIDILTASPSILRQPARTYVPVDHFVDLKGNRDLLLHFACLSAARLLRTALANATNPASAPALIERSAFVTDLPADLVPEFREYANKQGSELIKLMDRWLETRRAATNKGIRRSRTKTAGLHVLGFLEP